MSNRFYAAGLSLLAGACALAIPAVSHAGNVGYYFNCDQQGNAAMASAISASGNTPVNIVTPDAASLAGVSVLMVNRDYCSDTEWMANLPAITNAIQTGGLVLLMHDRIVTEPGYLAASSALPGASGITFVGSNSSNIDFPVGSPITNGPGGVLTNSSLDGGNFSNHGFVATGGTLPAGTQVQANNGVPAQAVNFSYPLGAGTVIYSSIPLDFYLGGGNTFSNVYAPNVVAWAVSLSHGGFTSCTAEGFSGPKITLCKQICEVPQSPARLSALIRTYLAAFREDPPCGR